MSENKSKEKSIPDIRHKPENIVTEDNQRNGMIVTKEHSGPLFTPEDLSRYESILSGAAERIFKFAENEQKQRHSVEPEVPFFISRIQSISLRMPYEYNVFLLLNSSLARYNCISS